MYIKLEIDVLAQVRVFFSVYIKNIYKYLVGRGNVEENPNQMECNPCCRGPRQEAYCHEEAKEIRQ